MAITYPLLQFGTVYATDDNLSTGTRYICTVSGLPQLTDTIGTNRALDGTIYSQYQTIKDTLITVTFPLIDTTKFDAIRDVVQGAITGLTTFSFNVTSDLGNFTFTAKPAEDAVTAEQTILSGKVANATFKMYCTD